jgi:hypothetical protein
MEGLGQLKNPVISSRIEPAAKYATTFPATSSYIRIYSERGCISYYFKWRMLEEN